jgi:imidazolonepropionase-like amidohydrolase
MVAEEVGLTESVVELRTRQFNKHRRAAARMTIAGAAVWWMLFVPSALSAPPAKVALTGGRIIPVVGEEIAKGTVLIENGRITAIGERVEIPYDAMEVDVSGKVLMPGFVHAHTWQGLDIPNESLPVTPFLDVYDAIDPSRAFFEDALRDGVSSVHIIPANDCVIGGVSRVVRPIGLSVDEMTVHAPVALKISIAPKRGFDRMLQMATLRETFLELADYLERLAEKKYEQSLEKQNKKIDVGPKEARERGRVLIETEDYDDQHRNLVALTTGRLGAFVYCAEASDVARAVEVARENGFFERTVLVLGPDCFKAIAEIKAAGRPVVLDAQLIHRERDPITGELRETFVPKVYADAGVSFSLLPSPDTSLAERYMNYQAARCVREGIDRATALKAITLNPAHAVGLTDRAGSLEVGKTANIVVLSGDPLDFSAWVDFVYIDGIKAYDRSEDVRLEQLFGKETPESKQ